MAKYSRTHTEDENLDTPTQEEAETASAPTISEEEETFKKRYGDLRRYMQQTVEGKDQELAELKRKLAQQETEIPRMPKTEEEIEQWAAKFPEVAKIVDSIAQKRAQEASKEVEQSMSDLRKMKSQLERERAEHQLKSMHPDFDRIRADKGFHAWVAEQPTYIKDALYNNETDAVAAARAIDLYKADRGMISKGRSDSQLEKEAARAVSKASKGSPAAKQSSGWSESRVASLKPYEFDKYEQEIMEAIANNTFQYDMQGGV